MLCLLHDTMVCMFSDPESNLSQLGLQPNEVVADFGAGGGAYTMAAAKLLKETGRVYAIDVQKELLTRIKNAALSGHLGNIDVIWGDLEKRGGTKLRDGTIDTVILSNVLFQAPDKGTVMDEAKRVLHPGGRMLLIDWTASFGNLGPTQEHVFPELEARKLAEKHGFLFDRVINAGNYHYGLVLRKGGVSFVNNR